MNDSDVEDYALVIAFAAIVIGLICVTVATFVTRDWMLFAYGVAVVYIGREVSG